MTPVLSVPAWDLKYPNVQTEMLEIHTQKKRKRWKICIPECCITQVVCPLGGSVRRPSQSISNDQFMCGVVCQN